MMESIKKLREMTGAGMMDVKKALEESGGDENKAVALLRERGIVKAAKKADREAKEGLVRFMVSEDGKRGAMVEVNSETDFVARNSDFQALVERLVKAAMVAKTSDLEAFKAAAIEGGDSVETELAAAAGKIGENLVISRVAYIESDGVVSGYVHSTGKIGVLVEGTVSPEVARDVALHVAAERPRYLHRSEVDSSDIEREREILTNKAVNEGKPENIVAKIVEGQISKFYEENVLLEQAFVKDGSKKVSDLLGGGEIKQYVRFEIGA